MKIIGVMKHEMIFKKMMMEKTLLKTSFEMKKLALRMNRILSGM